jgi:hypothetical protein
MRQPEEIVPLQPAQIPKNPAATALARPAIVKACRMCCSRVADRK